MHKRLFQAALVGTAGYLAYRAMMERERGDMLESLAMEEAAYTALEEGMTEDDVDRSKMRRLASSSQTLTQAASTRSLSGEDAITRSDIMIAAKQHCESQGGQFSDVQGWAGNKNQDIDGLFNMDLGLNVSFACEFGSQACREFAANRPDQYFDYDWARKTCVDRSPQRDICTMSTLEEFCAAHKDFCHKGKLTMGAHLSGAMPEAELADIIRIYERTKPMNMEWNYSKRACMLDPKYCESMGLEARQNAMGVTECYAPLGQRMVENVFDATTTRRFRVLWDQAGDGDIGAIGMLVVASTLMAAGKFTFGLSTVAAPFVLIAFETEADTNDKWKKDRWLAI